MKKTDWILLGTLAIYSLLFYAQTAGINYLLFNTCLIAALLIKDKALLNKYTWNIAAVGSLFSAGYIAWYGNSLSTTANIISLSILAGLSIDSRSSILFSMIYSFISPIYIIPDTIQRLQNKSTDTTEAKSKKISLIFIPIAITVLFFFIYKASNPIFHAFTEQLDLNFISLSWFLFILGGFLLLYGFFHPQKIQSLSYLDQTISNNMNPENYSALSEKITSVRNENFSGILLFALLNLLLLAVNSLNFSFMFMHQTLPSNLTHSEFVHEGTGTLIFSILVAIGIILYYFRGGINFYKQNTAIKLLAYLWILQNIFMLVSTVLRNNLYIEEYGLTEKRIGVYIYLLLTLIGLITTFIKVYATKSNMYLFRTNSWIFYCILIISSAFNWSLIITNYNIHNAKKLDVDYLLELNDVNLPQLYALGNDVIGSQILIPIYITANSLEKPHLFTSNYFQNVRSAKLLHFIESYSSTNWQSMYYDKIDTYKQLLELNKNNKITTMDLSGNFLDSISMLHVFNKMNELDLHSNRITDIQQVTPFTQLEKLDLSSNLLNSINGIEALQQLEVLALENNNITDYSPLYNLKNLQRLRISFLPQNQWEELQLHLPNTVIENY